MSLKTAAKGQRDVWLLPHSKILCSSFAPTPLGLFYSRKHRLGLINLLVAATARDNRRSQAPLRRPGQATLVPKRSPSDSLARQPSVPELVLRSGTISARPTRVFSCAARLFAESILARTRSTLSASMSAARSCCDRSGHAVRSKRGSRTYLGA
jgi:hypothetical protein